MRHLLHAGCRSATDYIAGIFYAAIAYDTSGQTINNGCFPTMNVRRVVLLMSVLTR